MKVMHYSDAPAKILDQEPAKGVKGRVVIGKKDGAANFCMRVFELSPGGYTPRHTHDWEHEIFVHSGKGVVLRGETKLEVDPGNVIFIPGGEDHQLRNAGDGIFTFVCLIPSRAPEI